MLRNFGRAPSGFSRGLSDATSRFRQGMSAARARALNLRIAQQAQQAARRAGNKAVRAAEKTKLFERVRSAWGVVTRQLTQLPRVVGQISGVGLYVLAGSLGFLAVFLIHQLLLWASINPAQAFENAKTIYFVLEVVWDTLQAIANAALEVVNVFIPGWNAIAQKAITPVVYVVLDILCLIFFQEKYPGIVSEENIPFRGFYCDPNDATSREFCGDFTYYYDKLYDSDRSGEGVVNGSLVFSPATGRRLSDAVVTPLVPLLDMRMITGAVQLIVTTFIVVGSQLVDVALHVAYTVLSELATLVLDLVWTLLNAFIDITLMLVRSGLLEKLITFAIDITIIYFVELFIPSLMYGVNIFLCFVNLLLGQNTWDAQLECAAYHSNPMRSNTGRISCTVFELGAFPSMTMLSSCVSRLVDVLLRRCIEDKCFNTAESAVTEMIVFTSSPIFMDWVYNMVHAAVYSKTGRSLFGDSLAQLLPGGKGFVFNRFPALQADRCASCFVCKNPEMRLVGFVIMTLVGCANPGYYHQFYVIHPPRNHPKSGGALSLFMFVPDVSVVRRAASRTTAGRVARSTTSSAATGTTRTST